MTTLTNTFEGGASGTTISTGNSGGASGSAFDVVTIGASATLTYDAAHAAHGTLAAKATTGASAVTSLAEWSTSMGTQTTVWFRMYLYFTANPAAAIAVFRPYNGATACAGVAIGTTGAVSTTDSAFSTIFTTTTHIPLNSWFRLEGFVTGSASTGQIELKLYSSPDSAVPTETHTSAASLNTFGALNNYRYGTVANVANVAAFWMDSIGLSNTGYLGPATAKGSVSIVPSLIAAGVLS